MDANELESALAQFTGTVHYYRIAPKFLITDGVKYLADNAGCYWLLDAAISHLIQLGCRDHFVLVRLVVEDKAAVLSLEDGNGLVHAQQTIPYTDFPLSQQTLYACWDGEHWVLMLPGEY
ncbi:DUF6876 family protein [Hydrogenophaga sp.]|uniref:DUF6876 family protein n=1 Tax=Hydrogenophaga sp. TaxID=1904254 RepID=UPI003F6B0594